MCGQVLAVVASNVCFAGDKLSEPKLGINCCAVVPFDHRPGIFSVALLVD